MTIIYYVAGTDFALVWGLPFLVSRFILSIGFMLSAIPTFTVTLLEFGFARAAAVVIRVIIINTIVDNYFSPKITGAWA